MPIKNTETGAYRSDDAVRVEYAAANFSPPFFPYPPDVRVQETARPSFNALTQDVIEAAPALVNGVWTQQWSVVGVAADVAAARLADAKAAAWERIKAERDRRKLEGGYTAGGKWFHSDTFSRTQQIGLVMLGANIPAGLQWKTMDGSFTPMTQTLAGQVFGAAAAQDQATFAAAETHKTAMEASADPAAYDFSAGWPAIYGG